MTAGAGGDPHISAYVDEAGRTFNYVALDHGAPRLAVHFTAFFGEWGNAKPYRDTFQGYYHRLKMLGGDTDHDWLFLCDQYGAEQNGTYYTGQAGNFFVERAMLEILASESARLDHDIADAVLLGSSMGGTAALKFGLMLAAKGIVAIAPHIDLDICAARQNREPHVAFIVPDGDTQAVHNHPYTRQVRNLLAAHDPSQPLPALFVQSSRDDDGVFDEQVVPLVDQWRAKGGDAWLDARPEGGHTSDFATRPLLLDVLGRLDRGEGVDVDRYQRDPAFAGTIVKPPLSHRARGTASRLRNRLLGR